MEDIKNYKPKHNSLTRGQVLACDYRFAEGKLVVKEMADLLCLDLIDKGLITPSATVVIGYSNSYGGHANGTAAFKSATNSAKEIVTEIEKLYDKIVDRDAPIKRINMTFNNVIDEANQQYDIFTDPAELEKERNMQKAMLAIKKKYGKNAILKGMDLSYGATTRERNSQIGGHNSDG
jgi:DNA polymerase V